MDYEKAIERLKELDNVHPLTNTTKDGLVYVVMSKATTCDRCGKAIKYVFEYEGKNYGYDCFCRLNGINIDSKGNLIKKPTPAWLYELAETILKEMQNNNIERFKNDEDFNLSYLFWETLSEYTKCDYSSEEGSKLFNKSFKIYGKNVKTDWQYEIENYMIQRRDTIIKKY